jgi:hypothetical protein
MIPQITGLDLFLHRLKLRSIANVDQSQTRTLWQKGGHSLQQFMNSFSAMQAAREKDQFCRFRDVEFSSSLVPFMHEKDAFVAAVCDHVSRLRIRSKRHRSEAQLPAFGDNG